MSIEVQNNAGPALKTLAQEIASNALKIGLKKTAIKTRRQVAANVLKGVDATGAEQKQNAASTIARKKSKGRGVMNKPLIGDERRLTKANQYRVVSLPLMAIVLPPIKRMDVSRWLRQKGYRFMDKLPAMLFGKPFMVEMKRLILMEVRKARKKAGI